MAVNGIGCQSFYETITGQKSNKKNSGNDFYNSLYDTIGEKGEVKEDTDNPIEQMAFETWNKARKSEKSTENIDSKWDEALLQFYNFVEDRVKNGAPKYQIGGSELSIDEWDKLLEKIDVNLDDIKDELAERVEKMKESEKDNKINKNSEDNKINESSEDNKINENSEMLILELLRDRT